MFRHLIKKTIKECHWDISSDIITQEIISRCFLWHRLDQKETIASNIVTMLAQNLLYLKAAELKSSGSCGIRVTIIMIMITQRLVYYHLSGHSRVLERPLEVATYIPQDTTRWLLWSKISAYHRDSTTTPFSIFTKYRARYSATRFTCTGRTTRMSSSFAVRTARGPVNWVMKRPCARRIRHSRGPDHRFVPSGSGGGRGAIGPPREENERIVRRASI